MSNLRILFVCAFLLNTFIWSIAASSLTRGNVKDSLGYPEQEDENQPSANSNNVRNKGQKKMISTLLAATSRRIYFNNIDTCDIIIQR